MCFNFFKSIVPIDLDILIKRCIFMSGILLSVFLATPDQFVLAQEVAVLVNPKPGTMVYAKKPNIQCDILVPFDPASVYIEFDYTDMTALAEISDKGFTLKPVQVLPPGEHALRVTFNDDNGAEQAAEFTFSSRHSKTFEQVYSSNNISATYTAVLKKTNDAKDREMNDWELEANLNSQNFIIEGPWELNFETNMRYIDQDLHIQDPIDPGLELMDYIFRGTFQQDNYTVNAALGDVQVDETRNTVSGLSRRGGTLRLEGEPGFVSGFVVRSDQVYGLDGRLGLDFDDKDHIYGFSGGLNFLENRLNIKTVYAVGGEESEDSYSIWPVPGGSNGDVYGIEIRTDFFEQKLTTTFEWDRADFDDDTNDGISSKSDTAYLAEVSGAWDKYNYRAVYEHTGPDYQVPGNYSIQNDWEGMSVSGGVTFETQSIQASYSRYNDNVDKDDTRQRTNSYDYRIDYNLNKIDYLPMSLGFSRSIQKSSMEPFPDDETNNQTDTYYGSITYNKDAFSIGLQPEYSRMNDKTVNDYDTSSKTLSLFASYAQERFSLSPSISFNRFKDHSTGVETDTTSYNLSLQINIIEGLTIEGTGGYGTLYADDRTVDQDNWNGDIQISYAFTSPIKGILSPQFILRATHNSMDDKIFDSDSTETVYYFIVTGNLDLSF